MRFLLTALLVFSILTPALLVNVEHVSAQPFDLRGDDGGGDTRGDDGGGDTRGDDGGGVAPGAPSVQNPLSVGTIEGLFQAIIDIVMVFAVPVIVFFIIYAGFLYVTARGNAEQISQGHKALLYALIGGLLIIGANVLIDVVAGTVSAVQ